jgi:hypothetical protein
VSSVVKAIFMLGFLRIFMINLVSLPTYVNFAHFVPSVLSVFCFYDLSFPFLV